MNKVELYTVYQKHASIDFTIWDEWFRWRLKQIDHPRHMGKDDPEYDDWHTAWLEQLHLMPAHYDWRPTDDGIVITWADGEETIPFEGVVEDLDKEPDLQMLWHNGYYDGPLSGMAMYNDEHVWFDCINETDYGDRIFALYRLDEKTKDEMYRRHRLFQELVGYHCDHDPNVHVEFVGCDKNQDYYKLQKKFPTVDVTAGEKLAEVHWYQFKYWARPR